MTQPAVNYVDPPDVPAGMTLGEYRRQRVRRPRGLRRRLRRYAGRVAGSRKARR